MAEESFGEEWARREAEREKREAQEREKAERTEREARQREEAHEKREKEREQREAGEHAREQAHALIRPAGTGGFSQGGDRGLIININRPNLPEIRVHEALEPEREEGFFGTKYVTEELTEILPEGILGTRSVAPGTYWEIAGIYIRTGVSMSYGAEENKRPTGVLGGVTATFTLYRGNVPLWLQTQTDTLQERTFSPSINPFFNSSVILTYATEFPSPVILHPGEGLFWGFSLTAELSYEKIENLETLEAVIGRRTKTGKEAAAVVEEVPWQAFIRYGIQKAEK